MQAVPYFTVVMPLYNHEQYVGMAIDSVLAQSFEDFELVICNDGSTDRSGQIAASYTDPRVRVINKPNGGTATALNACLMQSRGQFICWLSSDDIFAPHKLATHHQHHQLHPESKLSLTPYGVMNMEGADRISAPQTTPSQNSRLLQFLYGNYISGLSICAHRSLFELYGVFDDRYHCAQDVDRWVHFFRHERPSFLPGETQTFTRTGTGHEADAGPFGMLDVIKVLSNQLLRNGIMTLAPQTGEMVSSQEYVTAALEHVFNPHNLFYNFHLQEHLASVICYTAHRFKQRDAFARALVTLRERVQTPQLQTACNVVAAIVKQLDAGGIDQPIALVEALVQLKNRVDSQAQRDLLQKYLVTGF